MSNGRRHRRQRTVRQDPLEMYAAQFAASGMPEREVARAVLYAERFGLDTLSGPGCTVFSEPSCANWNCLNPEHQTFDTTDGEK